MDFIPHLIYSGTKILRDVTAIERFNQTGAVTSVMIHGKAISYIFEVHMDH